MKTIRSSFTLLTLCLLLTHCGWHLRGAVALPENIKSVYIDNKARKSELAADLRKLLQSNGVELSNSSAQSDLVIVLLEFNETQRVSSVNSNTIVREYELISEAEYEIKSAAGETLLEPNLSTLSRAYTFNQNAVVSASEEQRIIQRELRLELAQQILRRLRFLDTTSMQ